MRWQGYSALLLAPAKLTLSLAITGVRSDGYHLLDAEMVSVDLVDVVQIERGEGLAAVDEVVGGLGLRGMPTGASNLVARALRVTGRSGAVRLVKRIPLGAGLGGGSADAAAILRWAGVSDLKVAARVGADVPFCLSGGRARVSGVGEVVEPMSFEERHYTLLLLPFGMDTAAVFAAWDRIAEARGGLRQDGAGGASPVNDLERAAMEVDPRLAHWKDCLGDATGREPRLAGSGSTWFVEGSAEELGLADREFLVLKGAKAPLVSVRTVPPMGHASGVYENRRHDEPGDETPGREKPAP